MIKKVLKSKVDKIVVVLGFEADKVKKQIEILNDRRVKTVLNLNYHSGGMSSSVIVGVKQVLDSSLIFISPADIPSIPTQVINLMIDLSQLSNQNIFIPSFAGRKGHPILIKPALFPEVLSITEETKGLKEVIKNNRDKIYFVNTEEKGILLDIDTCDDIH